MSSTVGAFGGSPAPVRQADRRRATLEELRAELTTGRFATTRPVPPGLTELFPGGGLRRGASYVISGSTSLALALAAGSSQAGAWCGAVGRPDLGVEAAAGLGIEPSRLVLVPAPGPQWLAVVGTLADALDVVIVRPPASVSPPARDGEIRRLAARLRERGTTVLVDLPGSAAAWASGWPTAELRLEITAGTWHGLGAGHGHLRARDVTVAATGRATGGRPRTVRLWLPDHDGRVRSNDPVAEHEVVRELAEHRLRKAG